MLCALRWFIPFFGFGTQNLVSNISELWLETWEASWSSPFEVACISRLRASWIKAANGRRVSKSSPGQELSFLLPFRLWCKKEGFICFFVMFLFFFVFRCGCQCCCGCECCCCCCCCCCCGCGCCCGGCCGCCCGGGGGRRRPRPRRRRRRPRPPRPRRPPGRGRGRGHCCRCRVHTTAKLDTVDWRSATFFFSVCPRVSYLGGRTSAIWWAWAAGWRTHDEQNTAMFTSLLPTRLELWFLAAQRTITKVNVILAGIILLKLGLNKSLHARGGHELTAVKIGPPLLTQFSMVTTRIHTFFGLHLPLLLGRGTPYIYIPTSINPSIHQSVNPSMHTYIHTYLPTYLHTYIRTYVHTYIRTHNGLQYKTRAGRCRHTDRIQVFYIADILCIYARAKRRQRASNTVQTLSPRLDLRMELYFVYRKRIGWFVQMSLFEVESEALIKFLPWHEKLRVHYLQMFATFSGCCFRMNMNKLFLGSQVLFPCFLHTK